MTRKRRGYMNKKTLTAAEIAKYSEYLLGTSVHKRGRTLPGEKLERLGGGVIPFGLSPDTKTEFEAAVAITMTKAAMDVLKVFSNLSLAKLGIIDDPANVSGAVPRGWAFAPAVWIPTIASSTPTYKAAGKSAFTGRDTKALEGRSGSIPFGRTVAGTVKDATSGETETTINAVDYADMKSLIETDRTTVASGWKLMSNTFLPEEFYTTTVSAKGKISDYKASAAAPTI